MSVLIPKTWEVLDSFSWGKTKGAVQSGICAPQGSTPFIEPYQNSENNSKIQNRVKCVSLLTDFLSDWNIITQDKNQTRNTADILKLFHWKYNRDRPANECICICIWIASHCHRPPPQVLSDDAASIMWSNCAQIFLEHGEVLLNIFALISERKVMGLFHIH